MGTRIIEVLKSNTSYTFNVRAKNTMGQWGPVSDDVAHTTIYDTTIPATPAGQAILVATPNFFIIQWTLGSEKELEEYRIYVYTSNTPASAKIIKRVSGNTTRVMVNQGEATEDASITIAASTAYWFWITSVDQSGNESAKSTLVTGTLGVAGTGTDHGALTGLGDDDHTQYIKHSLATAASSFLVASGAGAFIEKTLAETQALIGGGASTFIALTDTPANYAGSALKFPRVNAGETALEFAALAGGGDVLGPATSVDNSIARFNGTDNKTIQDSLAIISDGGLIIPRITTIVSHATPTINTDNCDAVTITAQAEAITSMTTNLSGTPVNFQKLIVRIKDDGTARAIAWGAKFIAMGIALPTTTVISKILLVGFIYDTVTSIWGCVASNQET